MKFLVCIVMILPSLCWATPMKFSKCSKELKLKEVSWGSGVLFDETCERAYVLPPRFGSMEITGLNPTGNLELVCGEYEDIEHSMKSMTSSLKSQSKRIERLNKKVIQYEEYLEDGLVPVGMTIEDVEDKIDELLDKGDTQQEKYIKLWTGLKNLKAFYANLEGATGKFILESKYSDLVAEYQKKNPSIQFYKMPLEQSYLSINEKTPEDGDPTNLPMEAVISITSPGVKNMPLLKNMREPKPADEPDQPQAPGYIFTDALSGNINLSTLGVCPLMKSSGLPESINMSDLETFVSANVVYQYHAQVQRKHTITYNLAQLAKRIETSTKKGGFFSRKNVNSLVEDTESKKWITFKTYENDPTFTYSEEYKKEIKMQFLNSVLQDVAYVSFDNPGKYPSVVQPTGKSGVGTAADAVGKCPHPYCQVGMYALKFLDSTFGSTTAISNYIKTRDVWSSETVDQKKMVPYMGSFTLK